MKKQINTIIIAVIATFFYGCNHKEKRDLFSLTIAVNAGFINNGNDNDNSLPKEIKDILRPFTVENCKQNEVSKFWKANAQLIRLDLKEQKYIQISPNYSTDLTPLQDSTNYMNAVNGFKLTDDIFSKKLDIDSDYYSRNFKNILQQNAGAVKIFYNPGDSSVDKSRANFKTAHNIPELRSLLNEYLCSDTASKKILLFYKLSNFSKSPLQDDDIKLPKDTSRVRQDTLQKKRRVHPDIPPIEPKKDIDPFKLRDKDQKIDRKLIPNQKN